MEMKMCSCVPIKLYKTDSGLHLAHSGRFPPPDLRKRRCLHFLREGSQVDKVVTGKTSPCGWGPYHSSGKDGKALFTGPLETDRGLQAVYK